MTPTELAGRCASLLLSQDKASKKLGIELLEVSPGQATCTMLVTEQHCNGHHICHGGFIFTLADTAFAVACNSYNQHTVAQHNSITYLAQGQPGETLIARAVEVSREGRNGVYDVEVTSGSGDKIALFRGCSRSIKGKFLPNE